MAVRVIHGLEAIKIETEDGDVYALPLFLQRLLQLLVKLQSVGQAGQRIVVRHIFDLRRRPSPFGDVFVGGNPATVGHGRSCHQHLASFSPFEDQSRDLAQRHRREVPVTIRLVLMTQEIADLGSVTEDFKE